MLPDIGVSKKESTGNGVLKNRDTSRKRSAETPQKNLEDDVPKQLGRDTKTSEGSEATIGSKLPSNIPGSWKKNRTARKDGGAKRWENANSEVLQSENGKANFTDFSLGSLVWGKRHDGLWWPAEVSICDDDIVAKTKPKDGKHVLVKFIGLKEPDGTPSFSYLDFESVHSYLENKEEFLEQDFEHSEDESKFKVALAEANKDCSKLTGELSPTIEKSTGLVEKEIEMQDSSRKGSRNVSGSSKKRKEKQEIESEEIPKNEQSKKARKRKRDSHDMQTDTEEGCEPLPDTQIQSSSKKRKASVVNRGTTKENSGKSENGTAAQEKTRGDDGYFFECVVCDMGGNLLCCDKCPRTYHLECLDPPLKRTPPGKWHCPSCRDGIPAVKNSTPRSSETRRSRSMKHIEESHRATLESKDSMKEPKSEKKILTSIDTEKYSPKEPVDEKNESSSEPAAKKKSKKKSNTEKDSPKEPVDENNESSSEPPAKKKSKKKNNTEKDSPKEPVDENNESSSEPPANKKSKKKNNTEKDSPEEPVDENNESSSEPPTKKKSKKKSDRDRKKHKHDGIDKRSTSAKGLCAQCGNGIENEGNPIEDGLLCEHCHNSRSLESEISHAKDIAETHKSNKEPKKPLLEHSSLTEPKDETKDITQISTKKDNNENSTKRVQGTPVFLEVDRIFGCRAISMDDIPNMNKQTTKTEDVQIEQILESGINLGAEGTTDALTGSDNATEQESNSISGSDPLRELDGKNDKVEGDSECATVSGMHIVPKSNTEAVSRDREQCAVEVEDEETLDSQKAASASESELEFLVKWVGKSHIHDEWVKESELKVLAKRKLDNYKFKHGCVSMNLVDEKWCKPQRIIARRKGEENKDEVLVKWCGLPYDECTWEKLEEPVIQNNVKLLDSFNHFENVALKDEENPLEDKQIMDIRTLNEQPSYVKGGSLFPHQMEALNWLRKCWGKRKNVILADEMGLGKTISASVFVCSLYEEFKVRAPCLVLVPLSTMPNWMAEFSLWTPQLNVVEYHGGAKARANIRQYEWHAVGSSTNKKEKRSYKFNVLLTTYEMILADASQLRNVPWEVLIVDEGHRLKNTGSKLVQLLNTFLFKQRILLTGTPLQNNLGEMHNLLKFLQLDSFPSMDAFEEKYHNLSTAEQVEELKKLVAPHMLRRLKKDAMQNIPPKTERIVPVELSSLQAEYYRALLTRNYQVLRQAGKSNQHQSLVNIVVQLRKVCNHPYLIPGTEPETGSAEFLHEMRIKASAKLTLLHAMLKILKEKGHRVLVFSQMTKLLDILEDYLNTEFGSNTFERVDGSISVAERQAAIARFNQDTSRFVFLLSTRACGLGINLATADTVIIYDSDFNPHADIQAMNRAHRIGQSKRLLVYRLVVRASVEERILQLAKKKLMLDHLFVNKSGSQKEVEDIIRWGTEELFQDSNAVHVEGGSNASNALNAEDANETPNELDCKQRKKSGGLGDVYEDTCHKLGRPKIVWDDAAVARLLDRSDATNEATEADAEGDMLGSLKAWDWNDGDATEDVEASESVAKEKDPESPDRNLGSSGQGVEEESSWDKILRSRWEKMQTEEEGALGRGKRMRKAISYKENFSATAAEASYESGNEDLEEAEAEYTPAGRALKNKFAKLRARQKERIAARANFPPFQAVHYNISRENQQMLHLPSVSSFLPVSIPQDFHSMFPGVKLAAMNSSNSGKSENMPGVSTRVTVPDILPKTVIDLQSNEMKQIDAFPKENAPNLSSNGNLSCLINPSHGVQTSQSADLRASLASKMPIPSLPPMPQISMQTVEPSICDINSFGTAGASLPSSIGASPNLTISLGLGISSGTNADNSNAIKLKHSGEASTGLSNKFNSTNLANLSVPKLESDFSYGLGSLGPGFPHKDEKKGKMFPFLPYLGGSLSGMHAADAAPIPWSEEELDTLWSGVRRHGRGNWAPMLQDPKLHFSKQRTPKDLADRWQEEQAKMFGGSTDSLHNTIPGDANKPLLGVFGAGLPLPPMPMDSLPGSHLKDVLNSGLGQIKEIPKIDLEGLYNRVSKDGFVGLPGLGHIGADFRNRLAHLSSISCGNLPNFKDDLSKIDVTSLGQAKIMLPPDKQGIPHSSGPQRAMHQTSSLPSLLNRSITDSLGKAGLPGNMAGEGEFRFSNLQLRYDKGLGSTQLEPLELPKFQNLPDKLPVGLQDIPQFKLNLDLPVPDKLQEMKGLSLPHIAGLSKTKSNKDKQKIGNVPQSIAGNSDDLPKTSSSLPHWLREAFKQPAAPTERQDLPPTIAAISRAINLAYRDCKPTLPAWVNPGPPPMAPHRKIKKRRKRKKGIEFSARSCSKDQIGSLILPKLGKQSQFPLLSLGSGGILENSLLPSEGRSSSFLPNGPLFSSFPWTVGQNLELNDSGKTRLDTELSLPFPSLGSLPLPIPNSSETLKLPPLPSPFMPLGNLGNTDLSFESLFPKGKKLLDKKGWQQRWPFLGCSSSDSFPAGPELKFPGIKSDLIPEDIGLSKRKEKSLTTQSGDSSSKTCSDSHVKVSGGGQSNIDDASSEQTVSDSEAKSE